MENKNTQTANERKSKIITRIVIALAIVFSFVCGYFVDGIVQGKTRRNLNSMLSLVENQGIYVTKNPDGTDLSDDEFLKLIVKTILAEDEYAVYYNKQEYQAKQQKNKGNYSGYGLGFAGSNKIYSVVGNSPAEIAGLRANDVIEKMSVDNGEEALITDSVSLNAFFDSHANSTAIKFTVNRNGEQKQFTVSKQQYVASYVKYFDDTVSVNIISNGSDISIANYDLDQDYNLPSDTALIRLDEFMGDADTQFGGALDLMKTKGKTKLILDLRGNGGGRVDVLCKIAGYLIYNGGQRKNPIAFSQAKQSQDIYYTNFNKYNVQIKKTVVLADKNTASASECLIGAMLFYGKPQIDGNFSMDNLVISKDAKGNATTYGKGIMQTTFRLYSGEAIKFTTAKLYQPDYETCIQGVGITTTEINQVEDFNAINRAIEITLD